MPLCWIFLLKRRRALSNVSFSPTRTSANPGSPPQAKGLVTLHRARGQPALTLPDGKTRPRLAEHSRGSSDGQTFGRGRGPIGARRIAFATQLYRPRGAMRVRLPSRRNISRGTGLG